MQPSIKHTLKLWVLFMAFMAMAYTGSAWLIHKQHHRPAPMAAMSLVGKPTTSTCPGFVVNWEQVGQYEAGFTGMCAVSLRISNGLVSIVTYDPSAPIFEDGFEGAGP